MFQQLAQDLERPRAVWMLLGVFLLGCLLYLPTAMLLPIDGDEGFYLLAAKLVFQGQHLYTDFFYPQMPLQPYVYGLWLKVFGCTWYSARLFTALLAVLTGVLLYQYVADSVGKRSLALLAAALYCFSTISLGWCTVAKTHALATFLVMAALVLLPRAGQPGNRRRYLLSGLLLGLAVDTRLLFLAGALAVVIALWRSAGSRSERSTRIGWLLVGVGVGLLPNLWFIAANAGNYFFCNLGYHSLRTQFGLIGGLGQKFFTLLQLAGAAKGGGNISLQFPLLLLANCYYLVLAGLLRKRLSVACWVAAALAMVSLLPTPTFVQYFAVVAPFLIINSVLMVGWLGDVGREAVVRRSLTALLAILLAAYLLVTPLDLTRYLFPRTEPGVSGAGALNWQIATVAEVARRVDALTVPGEAVLTWWPGYLVESHSVALPKLENHFGLWVADQAAAAGRRLSQAELDRYRLISEAEIAEHLRERTTRVVVLGNWVSDEAKARYRSLLAESGYRLVSELYDTQIYLVGG